MPASLVGFPGVATRQGGVFTAAQARDDGWSERQIRRRLSAGRWVRVAGRGLALPADEWTPFQLAVAARLTWPECVVSHATAAALHGFPCCPLTSPCPADVITQRGRTSSRKLRVHTLRLDDSEVTRLGPVRLTTPVRTALDFLSSLPPERALDLWAWLSTRSILDAAALESAVAFRRGWAGTPALALIAKLVRDGASSGAELRLHGLLRRHDIRGWQAGARLYDDAGLIGVVDLVFRKAKVVVEVDGFRAHASHRSFVEDRRRQNRLVRAGYVVLRFTWDDLETRPLAVVAEIRAALGLP